MWWRLIRRDAFLPVLHDAFERSFSFCDGAWFLEESLYGKSVCLFYDGWCGTVGKEKVGHAFVAEDFVVEDFLPQTEAVDDWHIDVGDNEEWPHMRLFQVFQRIQAAIEEDYFIRVAEFFEYVLQDKVIVEVVLDDNNGPILVHV